MLKSSFQISDFKLKNVYGLPTLLGLVLAGILGFALWYSIFNDSNTERWLFIIMLFMFVINLLETSFAFRMIEIKLLPLEPPFCGEMSNLNFNVRNTSDIASGPVWIRLNGVKAWTRLDPLEADTARVITLQMSFQDPGPQQAPKIRIKTDADSGLYWFWRVIDPHMKIVVLPKAIDHHVTASAEYLPAQDNELSGFEEIRDPGRFKFTDPKMFLKTRRRYQRMVHSRRASTQLFFCWADLKGLPLLQQGEQFAFWIKSITALRARPDVDISFDVPFVQPGLSAKGVNVITLKRNFARWFYAKV